MKYNIIENIILKMFMVCNFRLTYDTDSWANLT